MKLSNAIKTLSKHGEVKFDGSFYYAVIGNAVVSFADNGGLGETAVCFESRRKGAQDDYASDYFAGSFWRNLTQAIKAAQLY